MHNPCNILQSTSSMYFLLVSHTAYVCIDRERLIAAVAETDNWPINKDVLIKKHYKAFAKFTKKMD